MEKQFFPELSERFVREERERLIKEADRARLVSKPRKIFKLFNLKRKSAEVRRQPARESRKGKAAANTPVKDKARERAPERKPAF